MDTNAIKYRYSFTAGAFAAAGSFFGKAPSQLHQLPAIPLPTLLQPTQPTVLYCLEILLTRALPIALMIVCNLLNWRYFLKALQLAEQTLTATVLTAATNYVLSFVLAALIYREPVTLLSTLGALLIVAGLWVLCAAQADSDKQHLKQKNN